MFVKTQFAGYEIHITIILLLKYLEKKYFKNFTVLDEGEFWETGNTGLLIDNFKRYTTLLNSITASLEINDRKQGESIEEYFKRIVLHIDDKKKGTAGKGNL